jgi:soluble lytic murein transglycosylase-like protein
VSPVRSTATKRLPVSTPLPHIETPVLGLNRADTGPLMMETRTRTVATPTERLAELPFNYEISRAARRQQLDPALVHAVITVESRYNAFAVSPKGATGLMQLMQETAERFGVRDRRIVSENVRAGTAYLRFLVDLFAGDLGLALAAYNAGEQAVIKNGNRIPPYPETLDYVPKVLNEYKRLRGPALIAEGATVTQSADGRVRATIPAVQ